MRKTIGIAIALAWMTGMLTMSAPAMAIDENYGVDPCYKQCSHILADEHPAPAARQDFRGCMAACQRPTAVLAQAPAPAQACPSGLVWRERFDGDTVCVLPGERDANRRRRGLATAAASACPSGLVWRERFDGDTVCVTPLERDANRRRRGLQ